MAYAVLDIETSIYESAGRKANPFDDRNYIVSVGIKYQGGKKVLTHIADGNVIPDGDWLAGVDCIIGINLKFDLLYLWVDPVVQSFFKRGGRIYDCQYAQYFISGQQDKWASMNQMSALYGGTQKEDKIKAYWESGVQTIDIPKVELLEYLESDLDNTEIIFRGIIKKAKEFGMVETIRGHMDGLCATIEMEYNGLKVDWEAARKNQHILEKQLEDISKQLETFIPQLPEGCSFNFGSGEHLSALLFGGDIKYTLKEQLHDELTGEPLYARTVTQVACIGPDGKEVLYKSGAKAGQVKMRNVSVPDPNKPKMRLVKKSYTMPGMAKPEPAWALAKDGVYKTDNKVIDKLAKRGVDIAKLLLDYKKYDKDLGTYYERDGKGMLTLVQGDIIHHSLNNVQTETGRLSSSKPNMQNIPRGDTSDVKEMFISRFTNGTMGELDYSQLEVVVQAVLTKDPTLIQHVNGGVDFHCVRLSAKLGEDYESVVHKVKVEEDKWYKSQRTLAKGFSFQRAYGAGKKAIALSTGMSEEEVQKLIDVEDSLYPRVAAYNRWVDATVSKNKVPTTLKGYSGHIRHFGWHPTPTGKRYSFTEYDAPEFLHKSGKYTSFKPTEMKNYSVQGAAGEMVIIVLGKLWRHFVSHNNYGGKALLVNCVHDCVWLDMDSEVVDTVVRDVGNIMESIPDIYKELFNIDIPVKFRVECEVGANMRDLHHKEFK